MPAPSDILRFMRGQLFETPQLPRTDFVGKTIVITGANCGLGLECAKQVAELKASVIVLGCRNLTAGEAAKQCISSINAAAIVHVWHIDLEDFSSVKAFAGRMKRELHRCDALVSNAGISTNEYRAAEGLERTLTVNVVSTFLLSILALPQLDQTAQASQEQTHLAIVGSNVHCFADHAQLQNHPTGRKLRGLSEKDTADMAARYFLSKLIVMLCVQEFASSSTITRQKGEEERARVIVNCPSPGWCKTGLFRQDDGGFMGRNMLRLIGRTAEVGGRTLTSAIVSGPETHGQYLSEGRIKPASVFVRSDAGESLRKDIWVELVDIIHGIAPEAVIRA